MTATLCWPLAFKIIALANFWEPSVKNGVSRKQRKCCENQGRRGEN